MSISRHNDEIWENIECWKNKYVLRKVYNQFYRIIAEQLVHTADTLTVELGSGIGKIKEVIPNCITTDIFPNPWIDRVENAYQLSYEENSINNLILFDIFHHLKYPGTALNEFHRVLAPRGRVLIFEPCMSLLGIIVYGLFHNENLRLREEIKLYAPKDWVSKDDGYYAAQGNASRFFFRKKYCQYMSDWEIILKKKVSAISYVASGGYSGIQLYPDKAFSVMRKVDLICNLVPSLFATRLMVVLEKR